METTVWLKDDLGQEFGVECEFDFVAEYAGSDIEPPEGAKVFLSSCCVQDASGREIDFLNLFSKETIEEIERQIIREEES